MKFQSVVLANFGSFEKAKIELDSRGLVLVQGDRRDATAASSNGAGKSTLFSALTWALYGVTDKGVSGDGVVRAGAKDGCAVSVTVEDGDRSYAITRYRKHPQHKNSLHVECVHSSAGWSDLTKGTDKLTQEVVDQIVGCSWEVFSAAVYAGQERVPDIPAMTDRQLKVLIEEAAGITQLERAYALAREEVKTAEKTLADAVAELLKVDAKLDGKRAARKKVEDSKEIWGKERDDRLAQLADDVAAADVRISETATKVYKLPASRDLEREMESLVETITDRAGLRVHLIGAESLMTSAGREVSIAEAAVRVAKSQRDITHGRLEALQKGPDKCDACGRDHEEATHALALSMAEQELLVRQQTLQQAARALLIAQKAAEAAGSRVEAARAALTETDGLQASLASVKAQIAQKQRLIEENQRAVDAKNEIVSRILKERSKVNPYDAYLTALDTEIAALDATELPAAKAAENAARAALDVAQEVARAFSPKGVRAHILDTVTPYLNDRTAHYLGALADGRIEAVWTTVTFTAKGDLKENFSVAVRNADGIDGFAALSGGEKRKVRLACALALQDLVATRATKPIDLFVADEIDAALDEAGLERLMGVLEDKARERGSVFVISHSDLKSWCSNAITVVRENGVSRVE